MKTQNIFHFSQIKKTFKVEIFSPLMMEKKPEKFNSTEKLNMDQAKKQGYFCIIQT